MSSESSREPPDPSPAPSPHQPDQPVEQQVAQPVDPPVEQPAGQQVEQPVARPVEQPVEQQAEQPVDGTPEPHVAGTDPGVTAVEHEFGRVTTDGRVFVRTPEGEREVGSWQAGDPAAGLAHFERRFDTLAAQVDLLGARLAAGAVEPAAALSSVARLRTEIGEANVVGDLTGLLARTDELAATAEERRQERRQARAGERAAALETRRRIADEAEQLAASDDWRGAGERFRQLVEEWKRAASADRAASDELWHRVSRAQSTFRKRRQQHAAALESARAETVRVKNSLIAEADALAASTDWRETSRKMADLMTAWKAAGRARRDVDDELWQRFRTARDRFYERRHAADSRRQEEFEDRVAALRGLVAEAEAIPADATPREAERVLRGIRERWAAVGPVPRAMADQWEDRLADVADRVRDADDEVRRRQAAATSPMIVTLREAVAQREARLAKARAQGRTEDVKAAEADLEVQRGWLRQAEESLRR